MTLAAMPAIEATIELQCGIAAFDELGFSCLGSAKAGIMQLAIRGELARKRLELLLRHDLCSRILPRYFHQLHPPRQ